MRQQVAECAQDAGPGDDRAPNLMLAASEVAANTPRNTPDGGTLRGADCADITTAVYVIPTDAPDAAGP